ncbi:hypothetical protein B0H11DRAFT_2338582, partial [Mycena galericulata]
MWTKISHALKSKQAQDGEGNNGLESDTLAGPQISPSKSISRKGVFHRDDGSLRLNSPLKLPSIPKKVKSTFNLHGNSSQLTLTPETIPQTSPSLSRRSSQEVLGASRPKATRRSSFNILTRRPSIDALRSPPETPSSMSRREEETSTPSRNRAATFGGSVRSILREPNTPGPGKNVRFFSRDAYDVLSHEQSAEAEYKPGISRSTPPEETLLHRPQRSNSASSSATPRFVSSSRRSSRPTVAEIFSPLGSITASQPEPEAHVADFFRQLDLPAISSLTGGLHVPNNGLPDALTSTPYRDENTGSRQIDASKGNLVPPIADKAPRLPASSHERSTSFSFGQSVFQSMDSDSNRSSSGKSSLISNVSDISSASSSSSSSPSMGRSRSHSDTPFMSMMRGKASEGATGEYSSGPVGENGVEPDPFSANATTYYTPQAMIPTTPPGSTSRHVRRASKEESIIFSLQTQLDLQTELCGQFEADLRARDEMVEMLGKKLVDAEEEDARKRKFLRAWKKKVAELERTCRFLEDEVEGSRQESMERSIMDEASSEALRMLHRQISGLEREREAWKRTEAVLREELRRLEKLAGEQRSETTILRESLGGRIEENGRLAEEALKCTLATMERKLDEEKRRHEAVEMAWQGEKDELLATMANIEHSKDELASELDDSKQQLSARDAQIAALQAELAVVQDCANKAAGFLENAETGKCALAMERDGLKLQVVKLQKRNAEAEAAFGDTERRVCELEDDIQRLWDTKESLETERDQVCNIAFQCVQALRPSQLKDRIREEEGRVDAITQELKASENRVIELGQERQYALDNVSRLEDNIRRRNIEVSQEHAAALETALTSKQMEIDAQTTALLESNTEIEQLKGQMRELQKESADKEVQRVQIMKQRDQDKHDLEGLNIALDSKQQELELLKRRLGIRGTAGNTPAQSSKTAHQRRESLVLTTPRMPRPSSFTSEFGETGRERKPSGEGSTKIPALSKSTRLNTSTNVVPTPGKRGSMGPPPLRSRPSIVGTPTATPRILTRSSSL